jgi:preprotein translocase subunit SecY
MMQYQTPIVTALLIIQVFGFFSLSWMWHKAQERKAKQSRFNMALIAGIILVTTLHLTFGAESSDSHQSSIPISLSYW